MHVISVIAGLVATVLSLLVGYKRGSISWMMLDLNREKDGMAFDLFLFAISVGMGIIVYVLLLRI